MLRAFHDGGFDAIKEHMPKAKDPKRVRLNSSQLGLTPTKAYHSIPGSHHHHCCLSHLSSHHLALELPPPYHHQDERQGVVLDP